MAIAQRKEGFLLEFEAEMRATGQVPDPRPVSDDVVHQAPQPRPARVAGDCSNHPRDARDVRDRAGARTEDVPINDNRECHICKKVGHIARNCPGSGATTTPRAPSSRSDTMAAHKTTGAVCESCGKTDILSPNAGLPIRSWYLRH